MQSLLELRGIYASYGKIEVLHGISLSITEGQIVSLLGANGAGKSTTLKVMSGLLHSGKGEIILNSSNISKIPAHKRVNLGIICVPEGRQIFSTLTVQENLEIGGFTLGSDKPAKEKRKDDVYTLFPRLKERWRQLGGTLSGGEQQMLAIGRGLMASPKVLLLDEPSLGLSPILVEQIFETLREINQSGVSILIVEQNARAALKLSSYAYILETGRITDEGSSSDLLNNPRIKKAYLGG